MWIKLCRQWRHMVIMQIENEGGEEEIRTWYFHVIRQTPYPLDHSARWKQMNCQSL